MGPKVSVVMPAFNAERYIGEAITSVFNQSFDDWELIVVDDDSSDSTTDVVREYQRSDIRVKLVPLVSNKGPAGARNAGISVARGRFLAFLDSDDLWFPEKLAIQVQRMEASGSAFCYSSYVVRRVDGSETLVAAPPTVTYEQLLGGSVIGCSTVICDTAQLGKVQFPDNDDLLRRTSYRLFLRRIGHEDYALWLSILRAQARGTPTAALGLDRPLVTYRIRRGSFSASKWRAALSQWFIYRNVERLGLASSLSNFASYAARALARRRN